jgi:outer membrane protein assembly factor BamB
MTKGATRIVLTGSALIVSSASIGGGDRFVRPRWRAVTALPSSAAPARMWSSPSALQGRMPRLVWHVPGAGRGTPAMRGGTVYFLSRDHEVVAIAANSGAVRWRSRTPGTGAATNGSVLAFAGPRLIVADDGLAGYDSETGRLIWSRDEGGAGPYLGSAAEGRVFAGSRAGRLSAFDGSGRVIWTAVIASAGSIVYAPVICGRRVLAGYSGTDPRSAGVVSVDARTGRERWRTVLPTDQFAGGPIVAGEDVIAAGGDGTIYGLARDSGRRRWAIPSTLKPGLAPPGPGDLPHDFRALARSGSLLIAGSLSGTIVAYDLDTHQERWRSTGRSSSVAFGLTADERTVYVPFISGELVALNAADGTERWQTGRLGNGFAWVPLIDGPRLYASASDEGFFAFGG